MRIRTCVVLLALVVVEGACSSTAPETAPDEPGSWASDQAALTTTNGVTTLEILASGCYGSYGVVNQSIPPGTFRVSGQYTQLMGVFPGKVDYPATFSGVKTDSQLTITVAVPALSASFGPFVLTRGVQKNWVRCLYP